MLRPPAEFDLSRAEVVPDLAAPALDVDGYSGKATAAGAGVAKGGGTGFLAGTVGCMGTGPFFPLCIVAVVPAATAVGAIGWGAASALTADGADSVSAKRDMLRAEFADGHHPSVLGAHAQRLARDRFPAARVADEPDVGAPTWRIDLALTEVACEEARTGRPFPIRLSGRVRVHRSAQPDVVYEKTLSVRSSAAHTTSEWLADDGAALKGELDLGMQRLAGSLLDDLQRGRR